MFVNYMPFIVLALFGIDRFITKKCSGLLILSLLFIMFTSYFFSVGSLIALFLFGLYQYCRCQTYTFKSIIQFAFKLCVPFLISVCIASVLLVPTAYTLLTGRVESQSTITLAELLRPQNFFLHETYSIGLTGISLLLLIVVLIKGKFEDRIFTGLLLLISFIPLFNYVLNGFMYINGKALMPFIPIILIVVAIGVDKLFKSKFKLIQYVFIGYTLISCGVHVIEANLKDELIEKKEYDENNQDYIKYQEIIDEYDSSFYRVNNQLFSSSTINKIVSPTEYKTSLYASTYHIEAQDFYYNELGNPTMYRNKFMTNVSSNLLSQIYMGEKYIVTTKTLNSDDYQLIYQDNDVAIYENINVLPIGYATNNYLNQSDYNALTSTDKIVNLIGNIINDEPTTNEIKRTQKLEPEIELIEQENVTIIPQEGGYKIQSDKGGKIKLKLTTVSEGDFIHLNYDVKPQNSDLKMTINGISNKLTDKDWKYYNENETFDYFFEGNILNIKLTEGTYDISNLNLSLINKADIINETELVDPFIVDSTQTKGDFIVGDISVRTDSYFTLSIPYDEGFVIKVDDKVIDYEKVNETFIGFKIDEGDHTIVIEYKAPLKDISLVISIVGIIVMGGYLYIERKKHS